MTENTAKDMQELIRFAKCHNISMTSAPLEMYQLSALENALMASQNVDPGLLDLFFRIKEELNSGLSAQTIDASGSLSELFESALNSKREEGRLGNSLRVDSFSVRALKSRSGKRYP